MKIKEIEISLIKPYEFNTKLHPETQIENIKESIKEFGFTQPIVIDKNYVVIIGHGRLEAAKQLGLDIVPCLMLEDLTDEEVRKLRIIDNKTNESLWDIETLQKEIIDLNFDNFEFEWGGLLDNQEISDDVEFLDQDEPDLDSTNKKTVQCPSCGCEFNIYE